ncbi:MAG: hypothetical protein IJU91_10440 [Selenomonadaceae bacterium]|nr:hypothetical protein [Selenomonadaceae bacterium]
MADNDTLNITGFYRGITNSTVSVEGGDGADTISVSAIDSISGGTVALSQNNSLADIDGSIVSAAGRYQVVDGKFTSFDTVTPEPTPSVTSDITSSVTSDTASVSVQVVNAVDLNLVSEGQTGYFVAQINSDSASVTPIFKTESPAENDTLFGNVTANKIYYAENNHGGQTVTIPSSNPVQCGRVLMTITLYFRLTICA